MKLLNTPLKDLNFEDVVDFCKEKEVEGVQVDYKKEFPQKGLAKHFASFSNTRGGIIIIGVEEDTKTGTPVKWVGVKNEGKLIDRVHQFAANVEPLPNYEVATTNEVKGKVFLLVRIFEGDITPYYVQNDSNIWVRTGNISNPVDIASPDALELLFRKKEKAQSTRSYFLGKAHDVYLAALKRAENERLSIIAEEKENYLKKQQQDGIANLNLDGFKSMTYKEKLGSQAAMSTIQLQPYYPHKSFISPLELKNSIESIRARGKNWVEFPSLNQETIPEGILNFSWGKNEGQLECEQLYGYGLVYHSRDVLWIEEGKPKIYLSHVARHLFVTLLATSNFYKHVGYQGNVTGYLHIHNVEGAEISRILAQGWTLNFFESKRFLLNKYLWDIDIDTTVLNSQKELQHFFMEFIKEIYVGLNCPPIQEDLLKAFLKDEGWLVE